MLIDVKEGESRYISARKAWVFCIDTDTKNKILAINVETRFKIYKELDAKVIECYNDLIEYNEANENVTQTKDLWFIDAALATLKDFTNS